MAGTPRDWTISEFDAKGFEFEQISVEIDDVLQDYLHFAEESHTFIFNGEESSSELANRFFSLRIVLSDSKKAELSYL